MLLIGVDEAGYGPNFGPLLVAATAWTLDDRDTTTSDQASPPDLYELLRGYVAAEPSAAKSHAATPPVVVADSKRLYHPGQGLAPLERGLLAAHGLLTATPSTGIALWRSLVAPNRVNDIPHESEADLPLIVPVAANRERIAQATAHMGRGCAECGVSLRRIACRAVFPAEFNELIETHGGKGAALSRIALQLLADTLAERQPEPTFIVCDKHGGRNSYRPLVQHHVPHDLVEVVVEGREASIYRWGPPERRVEIAFRARGESFLPTALASMAAKYLRELAMGAFNQFWRRHLPHVRPTAGYPQDARRFKADIAPVQAALGIDDRVLWRNK